MEERSPLRKCKTMLPCAVTDVARTGILRSTQEGSRWIVEPFVLGSRNSGSSRGKHCLRTSSTHLIDLLTDKLGRWNLRIDHAVPRRVSDEAAQVYVETETTKRWNADQS
jgi:hypothetical protein